MYLELDKPSHLRFISILCHQSKISSKVSIFINQPGEICLTKLGGFSFNNNKRSNYQAREKKTVKVDCECEKIKLVFEINYDNEINKFNQIGIIGIELYGEEISQTKIKIMKLQEEINRLENIKKKAVQEENYDLAKETNNKILQYKDLIQKLKEGKISPDFDIDNLDFNSGENKDKNDDKNNKNDKKVEDKKKIDLDDGDITTKRIVNKKKNVEKVSTGVSTNEKDNINRYMKVNTGPIDVDKQKVGNSLTFSQMVEKELSSNSQFSPYHNNNNIQKASSSSKKDLSTITDDDRDFINSIGQFLPEDILYSLVSKNVKEIEKAISSINEDLNLYNNNGQYKLFMNSISINDLVFTCSTVSLQILKKNYIPPKIQIIDVLNILLNQKYLEIIQVIKEFEDCLISLLDYLGDSNQKLREKVEKLIFEYAKKTKSGNKIINLIINTPIKKNLIKSRNHLNGRYLMVSKIVYFCGYMKNNFENIIKYAINGYALNKINVRDAALEIISRLYKYEGEKVHQYFQDSGLRPAQIKTIQDKLDKNDEKNNEIKNKEPENNENNNIVDEEHTCEFCGYYKPNITKDELNIHQYKDCPMLMQCNNCKQIIEISNLNNHLLNECDFKDKYIKCNKCKQVVEKDSINEHQSSENCFDVNEDKEKLCPLCHLNIIMDDIWKIHFLENGCQHNIRVATPSTTNASNFNK